jgi:two-component system response regulator FlrC
MAGILRVLLVDDDPAATRLYKNYLVADGHDVVVADSGIEAVEATERQPFDVIVMDLMMPGLDGWMSMSLIKARRPLLPVVVLTSDAGKDLESRAKTAGAAAFLTKPCAPEVLTRALRRAVAR